MQKQHNSTKAQDQHLEGKTLKPQLPHQQPSQHDIFPPTSMCGEKKRWKGEGGGNILAWEKSFFEKKRRNQNGQKDSNISATLQKSLEYKSETKKTSDEYQAAHWHH